MIEETGVPSRASVLRDDFPGRIAAGLIQGGIRIPLLETLFDLSLLAQAAAFLQFPGALSPVFENTLFEFGFVEAAQFEQGVHLRHGGIDPGIAGENLADLFTVEDGFPGIQIRVDLSVLSGRLRSGIHRRWPDGGGGGIEVSGGIDVIAQIVPVEFSQRIMNTSPDRAVIHRGIGVVEELVVQVQGIVGPSLCLQDASTQVGHFGPVGVVFIVPFHAPQLLQGPVRVAVNPLNADGADPGGIGEFVVGVEVCDAFEGLDGIRIASQGFIDLGQQKLRPCADVFVRDLGQALFQFQGSGFPVGTFHVQFAQGQMQHGGPAGREPFPGQADLQVPGGLFIG